MRRFILFTSINTRTVEKALENIGDWQKFDQVAGVRLIQNDRESWEISARVNIPQQVKILNTGVLGTSTRSPDNPKGLPSLRELLCCMRQESMEIDGEALYLYLNSDIVIRDKQFFEDIRPASDCITLLHRKDVSGRSSDTRDEGFYIHGVDGFCASPLRLNEIVYGSSDIFYLGLPGWDQYLPLLCWVNGWKPRFICSQFAVHKMHSTSNPGSYDMFARRLVLTYLFEFYLRLKPRNGRRIAYISSWIKVNDWSISLFHKVVVFPALRSLGWRIMRRSHKIIESTD